MVCVLNDPQRKVDSVVSWIGMHDPGPFIIPYPYPVLYCGNKKTPDMTLVAAVWSPEGFAIAADGLQVETHPPMRIENAQKIFYTPFRDGTGFAYACAGTCRIGLRSGRSFDFLEATKRVIDELAGTPFPNNPADYFNEIGKNLFQKLAEFPADVDMPESRLLLAGYASGTALWAELVFSNTGTRFAPPVLALMDYSPRQFMVFAGSNTVYGDMQIAGKLFQPMYLKEAIGMVQEYAQMCIENNTAIEDCTNLGGHIHVATITKEGFTWIKEPNNL